MDKGFGSVSSSTSSNGGGGGGSSGEMYLKQVNKNSQKISKPVRKPLSAVAAAAAAPILEPSTQLQSQQPPVYNINKNDFRDVVQKLTGSPSHERFPTPPPVSQPRPSSSRLQRIRPPPLVQIGNRPPQLTQVVPRPNDADQGAVGQPLQPLPPLPSVHPAAESPISAYMRFIQNSSIPSAPSPLWNGVAATGPRSDSLLLQNEVGQRGSHPLPLSQLQPIESPVSTYMRFLQSSANSTSAALPRWNSVIPPLPQPPPPHTQQQLPPVPSPSAWPSPFPVLPLSPLPFGCIPSPMSPYAILSPSLMFSPTGQLGLPQLPLSPTVPLPSPRWKGL